MPLSDEARRTLLIVAREAISAYLGERPSTLPGALEELRARRGAFVTLRRRSDGELRGCIGLLEARRPLVETVAEAAVSAASADPRFAPVTAAELPDLALDISALGPLEPIRPDDVLIGTHGLVIRCAGRSGLLLPQVPLEHGWDHDTFLAMVCRKAGLPHDAWRRTDAQLLGFTAEVFGEE